MNKLMPRLLNLRFDSFVAGQRPSVVVDVLIMNRELVMVIGSMPVYCCTVEQKGFVGLAQARIISKVFNNAPQV